MHSGILLFVILILTGSNIWAAEVKSSRADKYSSYFYKSTPSKEIVSKIASSSSNAGAACSVGGCLARNTISEIQAIFLMASLASVEGMKQQVEISGIKKEQVSSKDLATVAIASAEAMIESSQLAGGLGGMFLTNKAMKVPLDAWNSLVMNASARPLLKEMVANSSANLVGFIGFEAGSELISRAIQMIPDESDREKASRLAPTMWGAFTSKDAGQSKDEMRIISKVGSNMYEILVQNEELREKWWSFVMRNRIQTGNFTAGIAIMATGATIGNGVGSCFPNPIAKIASRVIGAAFGFVGGVAASFVPVSIKDDITMKFQSGRLGLSTKQIQTSQINLSEAMRKLESEDKFLQSLGEKRNNADSKFKNIETLVNGELTIMQNSRENLMTSFFDRTHLLNSRLYNFQNKMQLADDSQNPEAKEKLKVEFNEYFSAFKSSQTEIEKKISNEITYFEDLSKRTKSKRTSDIIKSQLEELKNTKQWTGQFLNQIESTATWGLKSSSAKQQGLMTEQDTQRLLEKMYMWGYKQKPFVETMEFNN